MYVSALASQRLEGKIIARLKIHFSELFNFNISVIGVSLLRLIEKKKILDKRYRILINILVFYD